MKQKHATAASVLQEKAFIRGWKTTLSPTSITLYKTANGHTISASLEREGDGYILAPFVYPFRNSVSFFDYANEETRWCRNKVLFFSLINLLKESAIWDLIKNKDCFLRLNPNNKSLRNGSSGKIKAALAELLSEGHAINPVIRKKSIAPKK
jgi:hypothetical protein